MKAGVDRSAHGAAAPTRRKAGERYILPILRQVPRLLTQVDRNAHSPTYGSCCRNHWHYRIEDISNSQFQELVLTLALAHEYDSPANPYHGSDRLLAWIRAILEFTLSLQRPSGSFDEVYKGQDSYAATAFVLFTHTETIRQLGDRLDAGLVTQLLRTFERSARWLARTRETFAANQMAGAAAALFNMAALTGDDAFADDARSILRVLQAAQSTEGWFEEYGGADIGYGSLTAAYLALIGHRTEDPLATEMAAKSLGFLRWFLHDDHTAGGEYGSRNTEYFIPVAPVLLASVNVDAATILGWLERGLDDGRHAIVTECLDDRYLAYLSPFYMLAGTLAEGVAEPLEAEPAALGQRYFPASGMLSVRTSQYHLIASLFKGAVLRGSCGATAFVDDGLWGRMRDGRVITTQQLDRTATVSVESDRIVVSGSIHVRKPVLVTPFRNILVRGYNLTMPALLRRRFLDFVRRMAVSAGGTVGRFTRTLELRTDRIDVEDRIELDEPVERIGLQLDRERAFSFASTGFFQPQELDTNAGLHPIEVGPDNTATVRRTITRDGIVFADG